MNKSKADYLLELGILEPPAYPKTGKAILEDLRQALNMSERHTLEQIEFGRLIGAPRSTIDEWVHGTRGAAMKGLIAGMERLPEPQRVELLRKLCRKDCPRIDDTRFVDDPEARSAVRRRKLIKVASRYPTMQSLALYNRCRRRCQCLL